MQGKATVILLCKGEIWGIEQSNLPEVIITISKRATLKAWFSKMNWRITTSGEQTLTFSGTRLGEFHGIWNLFDFQGLLLPSSRTVLLLMQEAKQRWHGWTRSSYLKTKHRRIWSRDKWPKRNAEKLWACRSGLKKYKTHLELTWRAVCRATRTTFSGMSTTTWRPEEKRWENG